MRSEIAACLWEEPEYADTANGINTAVNRLRAALSDQRGKPAYIETVVGVGYRFLAPVTSKNAGEENPKATALSTLSRDATSFTPVSGATSSTGPKVEASTIAEASAPADRGVAPETSAQPASASRTPPRIFRIYLLAACVLLLGVGLLVVSHSWWRHLRRPGDVRAEGDWSQATFADSADSLRCAAISHTGQMLAFANRAGISVRSLDRGVDRLLWSPPAFEPTRLTWMVGDNELLISGKDILSGEPQVWNVSLNTDTSHLLLRRAADAVLAPDGAKLAFSRNSGSELWTSALNGSQEQQIRSLPAGSTISSVIWSEDAKRISYEERSIPTSPAGSAFETPRSYSWEFDTVSADSGRLLDHETGMEISSGAITRDGQLYFLAPEKGKSGTVSALYAVRMSGRTGRFAATPQRLATITEASRAFDLSASDDGKQLALLQVRRSSTVYVADFRSAHPGFSNIRRLAHPAPDNYPHAWLPNSNAVLFESDALGKYAIFRQALDGSPAELLVRSLSGAVSPRVSPDGRWILFLSLHNFHPDGIYRAPIGGGEIQRVPLSGSVESFNCPLLSTASCVLRRADGRHLLYKTFDSGKGEGKEFARVDWSETAFGDWSLSPDGQTIAVPIRDPESPGIRLLSLDKASASQSKDISVVGRGAIRGVSWDSSAHGFFVQTEDDGLSKLNYVDLKGRVTVLWQSTAPVWAVPSPDGTKVAYVAYDEGTNAWVRQ